MNAELREWYKAHHICADCGQEPAFRNYTQCVYCRMKAREKNKKSWEKVKDDIAFRKKENERQMSLYNRRKELGLCPSCGVKINDKKYLRCEKCRTKDRNNKKNKRIESGMMPQEIRTSGIYCYNCLKQLENQDVKNGIRVCKECREKNAKALEIARASRNPENDYFRKLNTEHFEIMKQGRRTK